MTARLYWYRSVSGWTLRCTDEELGRLIPKVSLCPYPLIAGYELLIEGAAPVALPERGFDQAMVDALSEVRPIIQSWAKRFAALVEACDVSRAEGMVAAVAAVTDKGEFR